MLAFEPSIHVTPKVGKRSDLWWKGAVIYQIYPRSFADSNSDGTGDLAGITDKLDYVASLNVDAIWISPFMKSPQADYGYDVEDYCDVDAQFGTLGEIDVLIEKAHKLDLKVMVDFVPSHTSDRHPWFIESRSSQSNPKSDWYVWADPKPDGTAPNNWLSVFGGPAWQFDTRRGQYYLHNFLKQQPDLNFHNPSVIDALTEQAKFWFERGVDGFRIDAIDFGVHDAELRDNPAREPVSDHAGVITPFGMQYQQWNKAHPELSEKFFKPIFRLSEQYDSTCLLGEISGDTALERMADYSGGGGLDIAYSFDLLTCEAGEIREIVEHADNQLGDGWACWAFSNHDVKRSATRFGGANPDERLLKLIPQLLTSLRGSVCLYQGEELGLSDIDIAYDQIKDPVGLEYWPENKGRDGCRTPMPWTAQDEHGGFTSDSEPWLPIGDRNHARAVDRQDNDPNSVLNNTRAFLRWRRQHDVLKTGDIHFLPCPPGVVAFARRDGIEGLICAFNLTADTQQLRLPTALGSADCPTANGHWNDGQVTLEGYATFFARTKGSA